LVTYAMAPLKKRAFVLGNFVQACCWQVPRLPLPGETLVATGLHIEAGGKGLNVAVCLQRLGLQVDTLIGCGNDAAGDQLLALLQREGISTQHVHRLAGASGCGSGWIGADGHNAIAVYPGANLLLTAGHARQAAADIAQAQLVYGQFETSMVAVETAFAIAQAHHVPTVLNPSPWQPPSTALRSYTHTLIVNETEAQALLVLPAPLAGDAAQCARRVQTQLPALWAAWPALQQLVVTLGAQGCLAWTRAAPMKAPVAVQADVHVEVAAVAPAVLAPAAVTPTLVPPTLAPPSLAPSTAACWYAPAHTITATDTVGAGDAFASGYCAALMAGHAVPTALQWGNACGAQVASCVGVLDALPGADTLQQWLAQADAPQVVLMALL
jgi:ribokinase